MKNRTIQNPILLRFSCGYCNCVHEKWIFDDFWVPRSFVPQKQHVLRFGGLWDGLEQEPKIMILGYLGVWAFWCQKSNLSFKMCFFGLKSIKTFLLAKNCTLYRRIVLKMPSDEFTKNSILAVLGIFVYFLTFFAFFLLESRLNYTAK